MINRFPRVVLSAVAVVVLLGVISPAQVLKGSREYNPQWGGFHADTLNKELKLTPQQQTQIKPILEGEQARFAQIREGAGEKIQAVLTPGQQKRFKIGGPWANGPMPVYSPQWGGFVSHRLTQELKLNKDQEARISPILSQAQTDFKEAHEKAGAEIAAALSGDQQKKFQAISRSDRQ